jgi:hypothetical protein
MHAPFRRQEAVRVGPVDDERCALDPRLLPRQDLVHLDVEAVALGPPQVHPQQHLRPVLRLGAARAGVESGDGVVVVVLAPQEHGQLEPVDLGL